MIKEQLEEIVKNWNALGHPALLENFILRNGKEYTPTKRIGRRKKAKECFCNAHKFVWSHHDVSYVEGYVIREAFPFPIHHAWVTITGDDAMDPTLEAEEFQYYGVAFDRGTVTRELIKNKVYGLLDPGLGLNYELMFDIDPELKTICERIMQCKSQRTTQLKIA